MTTVAVLADPPRDGLVLPALVETTPLTAVEATDLYTAMLRDVCRGIEESGGDLLVNYRANEDLPEEHRGDRSAEAAVRAAVRPALADPDAARFEVQVGSSFSARAGNTVSHLLEQEGVDTAAVVEPTAPFLGRRVVDNAAMKLRRHEVVLGPSEGGRVYYAGFSEPIDFADTFAPPAIETLTERAVSDALEVDFLPSLPVVETDRDLVTVLTEIAARANAGRIRPEHTAELLADLGLDVVRDRNGDGRALTLIRE